MGNSNISRRQVLALLGGQPVLLSKASGLIATPSAAPRRLHDDGYAYPINGVEASAGVTSANVISQHPYYTSLRYGVAGDGRTDDTAALNRFFAVVTAAGAAGQLQPGTFRITSKLTILIGATGFSIAGSSAAATIFMISESFAGSTVAMQLKGTGTNVDFQIGGFTLSASPAGSGAALTGWQIGDPTTAAINIQGLHFSRIYNVQITDFKTNWHVTHARQINFSGCAGWSNALPTSTTILLIDQNGASTSDLVFDSFQAVCQPTAIPIAASGNGKTATLTFAALPFEMESGAEIRVAGMTPAGYNGTHRVTASGAKSVSYACAEKGPLVIAGSVALDSSCIVIRSPIGPFDMANGNCSIGGIKFNDAELYSGAYAIQILAEACSWINDVWLDNCEVDQLVARCLNVNSTNPGSTVIDIHVHGCFFNKSTNGAVVASTGPGGTISDVWVDSNWIDNAQQDAVAVLGGGCRNLHINNNSIVDCNNSTGAAIRATGATGVQVTSNRAQTGIFGQRPMHLIELDSTTTDISCIGNGGAREVIGPLILDNSGNVTKVIANNPGFNPLPQTAIRVGASPFMYTNTTGAAIVVYVQGGAVSSIATQSGLISASTTNSSVTVPQGGSIIVTYSVPPTMAYLGT